MKKIDTTGWKRMDFVNFYTKVWDVPVIPIDKNKKPMVEWSPYQSFMPTEEELDKWFNKWKAWGLAIICQHRLFSPDFDTPEVYKMFKQKGAFSEGTCIYETAKGYHTIMRSSDIIPYSVKEHDEALAAIDPLLYEFGISGNNGLAIVPDTPDRHWIKLYQEPVALPYEWWLEKYTGRSKATAGRRGAGEWLPLILCPWHENDGLPHDPSLHINIKDGGFYCHGCGKQGKLSELIDYCKSIDYKLPNEVYERVKDFKQPPQYRQKEYHLPTLQELINKAGMVSNLIPNMLSRGEVMLWYGAPKAGKTMQMQALAASAIKAEPIFGIFPIVKPLKVIYFSYEMSGAELGKRFTILMKGEETGNLGVDRYQGANFPDPEFLNTIRSATSQFSPDIVIHDPLINMHSLDENRSQDMQTLFGALRADALEKNYGIILIHHTGVEKQDEGLAPRRKRPRGSSAIEGCVDLSVLVQSASQKYVRTIQTDLIRAIGVSDWKYKIVFDPVTLKITSAVPQDVYGTIIEDIVIAAGGEISKKELADKIGGRLSMERSQPYKIIDKAEKSGRVVVRGEGKKQMVVLSQEKADKEGGEGTVIHTLMQDVL